ncbi:hypothetical protein [Belnapia moabensis]|uniref:hypothetical protein n=1 Tax=Belnapia moabensis TaxID=365533 RepID=UPI0012EE5054|nr:hypothetical protein [Belnapia moabensis]
MTALVQPTALGGPRTQRRRRLAGTLRWLATQEALSLTAGSSLARPSDPLALQVQAMADEQRLQSLGADLPEQLARVAATAPIPPEVCAALAAILLPLLHCPAPATAPLDAARNPSP